MWWTYHAFRKIRDHGEDDADDETTAHVFLASTRCCLADKRRKTQNPSSTHPFTHPPIQLSTHPPIHPSTHPSISPFTHLSTYPPAHPSIHPLIHPPIQPLIHPCIHPYPNTKLCAEWTAKSFNLSCKDNRKFRLSLLTCEDLCRFRCNGLDALWIYNSYTQCGLGVMNLIRDALVRAFQACPHYK